MSEIRIAHEVTEDDVLKRAGSRRMAFYGANTMWWTSNEADLYKKPGGIGLPCDPRGGMLFQTAEGDLQKFLDSAKENVEHYGKHGLRAFYASYHGVVVTEDGKPTCFTSWDEYNALLDKHDTAKVPQ